MNRRGVTGGSSLPRGVWGDGSPQKEKPAESEEALLAVAHGSADPRAAVTIGELMTLVAARAAERGRAVPDPRVAYLGHAAPSLPQALRTFGPGAHVTVLPLLLTAAYHSKTDIPRVLARLREFPRLRVSYGATLGPHPLLLSALERRLAEADPLGHAGLADPARRAQRWCWPPRDPPTRRRTPPSPAWRRNGRPGPGGSRYARPARCRRLVRHLPKQ